MKENNFILSFIISILFIYLVHFFGTLIAFFMLYIMDTTFVSTFIEFLSPFLSYWILKKYFFNNIKIRDLFFNYKSVKKYAISLFLIESLILLLLGIIGLGFTGVIFVYLIYLHHFFSFVWYTPFLIFSYISQKKM